MATLLEAVSKVSHSKKADAVAALRQQLVDAQAAQRNRELIRIATRVGLSALGGGAALRGGFGLAELARRNTVEPPPRVGVPDYVDVPIGLPPPRNKEKRAFNLEQELGNFFRGGKATKWWGHPAAPAAIFGSTLAGGAAGYGLADWLLDKRRQQEANAELTEAQQLYEEALRNRAISGKSAEESSKPDLGTCLDQLYDLYEKKANAWDLAGFGAGNYLALLGALGTLGTYAGYRYGRGTGRRALLEEAQRVRRRNRYSRMPPVVLAHPVAREGESEQDEKPNLRAAPSLR